MENGSTVKEKSYHFAIRIVKLCMWLKEQCHYELSSQVLRSGTSIGANIEEASASCSKKEFVHKMAIASNGSKRNTLLAAFDARLRYSDRQTDIRADQRIRRANQNADQYCKDWKNQLKSTKNS